MASDLERQVDVRLSDEFGDTEFLKARFDNYRFPAHFHDTFVIQLVHSGVDWCSGTGLAARSGELCVHFPFSAHTGGTHKGLNLHYVAAYPTIEFVSQRMGVNASTLKGKGSFVSQDPRLIREAKSLFQEGKRSGDFKKNNSMTNLLELILDSARSGKISAATDKSFAQMFEIRRFLTKHFRRDLSNRELSERFFLSEFHLIRTFKRCFGITPRQYIISLRVIAAKDLISGGATIAEAAYQAGFSDQSHLARQFKRITGYRPSELKR